MILIHTCKGKKQSKAKNNKSIIVKDMFQFQLEK